MPIELPEPLELYQFPMPVEKRHVDCARQRLVRWPLIRNGRRTASMSRKGYLSHRAPRAPANVATMIAEDKALGRGIRSHWCHIPDDSVRENRCSRRPDNLPFHAETLGHLMIWKATKEPHVEGVAACPGLRHHVPLLVAGKPGSELIPSGKPPGGVYRSQSKLDAPRSALSRILLQQGCLWTNPCVIARADFVQDPLGDGRFIQPVTRVFIQRQLVAQR